MVANAVDDVLAEQLWILSCKLTNPHDLYL